MRLSNSQWNWLVDLEAGRNPVLSLRGRSEHGGASGTRASLFRQGLVNADGGITDAGREALKKQARAYRRLREETVQ